MASQTGFLPAVAVTRALDETLLWLCATPSPIGDEKALCDAVEARLARLPGIAAPTRVLNSLVVHLPSLARRGEAEAGEAGEAGRADAPRRPRIALVGHLDTVRTENGPARIDDGRCFGAGASDMKSGLAVMLVLAETLARDALACDLDLVFYSREEGPFADNELGAVLDACPELGALDLAVCLEPSDNKLSLGCNGSIHATVTFEGRTAHSARPWEGESAVSKAAPFLVELAALVPRESVLDGLVYRTVTTVTRASDGGRGRNVVPDRFVVNVNHRFAPDTPLAKAREYVLALVGGRGRVEFTDLSPGARPNAGHPLVLGLVRAGARSVEPKQAWTDVARFAEKGVAAVNFGPGENAQAHQKDESTALALLHESYGILLPWLTTASLLSSP